MKKVGVLFDLDGVLIDSEDLYTEFWEGIEHIYPTNIPDFAHIIKGNALFKILNTYYPRHLHQDIINRVHSFELNMVYPIYDGVIDFLEELKSRNLPCAIVTSSDNVIIMFGFSVLTLVIMSIVMAVMYHKNGDRKRAYLAATSVEIRGAENVAEGASRHAKLALTEAIISTAVAAVLWLIPAGFYTAALASSGMGYGYADAWGIEVFFVGAVGFFQPFQNAWVGLLVGMGILFCFHYFGRLLSHKSWTENRIRK